MRGNGNSAVKDGDGNEEDAAPFAANSFFGRGKRKITAFDRRA
jgi:hypothetical protein